MWEPAFSLFVFVKQVKNIALDARTKSRALKNIFTIALEYYPLGQIQSAKFECGANFIYKILTSLLTQYSFYPPGIAFSSTTFSTNIITIFNLPDIVFFKLVQSFRVLCLFKGLFNTEDYGTLTDVSYIVVICNSNSQAVR